MNNNKSINTNNVVEKPLDALEKKLLRRTLKVRVIFGFIFITPLLLMILAMLFSFFQDFKLNALSISGIILFGLTCFLLIKYVVPFYKNSITNVKATYKQIVKTRITSIDIQESKKGIRYIILTDFISIDSWAITLLINNNIYSVLNPNDKIEIHYINNNIADIIAIKQLTK